MKKILILVLFGIIGCIQVQIVPEDQRKIEKNFQFPNINKATIYNKSLLWVTTNINSKKNVIELTDKENGIIVGNGYGRYCDVLAYCTEFDYKFILKIQDENITLTYMNINYLIKGNNEAPIEIKNELDAIERYLTPQTNRLISYISN